MVKHSKEKSCGHPELSCFSIHRELLGYLTKEQLTALEQALCSAEGLGTLNRKKLQRASNSPRQVPRRRLSEPSEPTAATAAPSHLHPETPTNSSIQRRSYNPDSQDNSATAFEPDSVTEVRPVETTEEPQFPNLGVDHPIVNDLSSGGGRSRSETHSSAASTSATAATASCELTNIPSNSIVSTAGLCKIHGYICHEIRIPGTVCCLGDADAMALILRK